jgi:tetratricopeptide (TPR) repeat protein
MKKLFFVILFFLFSQVITLANEKDTRLNQLFNELKVNKSKIAIIIEQEIWALWSKHPTNENLTARLEEGSQLVRDQQYIKAKDIFTEVINLDQSWAEAWNKRATVLYLLGEFQKSQDDIDKVLALEPRHFGALAGQGLVNIQLKNYEKAIRSYEKAQEIYPSMRSPKIMIKQIEELIKEQTI